MPELLITQGDPKSISTSVLTRFMTDKEIRKFMETYKAHRKATGYGAKKRKESFESPISADELIALKRYVQETDVPASEIGKDFNIPKTAVRSRMATIAFRYLYQNPKALK